MKDNQEMRLTMDEVLGAGRPVETWQTTVVTRVEALDPMTPTDPRPASLYTTYQGSCGHLWRYRGEPNDCQVCNELAGLRLFIDAERARHVGLVKAARAMVTALDDMWATETELDAALDVLRAALDQEPTRRTPAPRP